MSKFAALGQGFNLLAVLANNTEWEDVDRDAIQRMIDDPKGTGEQFTVFLQNGGRVTVPETAPASPLVAFTEPTVLVVDYGQTLEHMIAAGRYDWKNDDITAKRFPIEGKGTVEFEASLFHFDHDISSEDAKRLIEEAGWEVAKIEHLLSYGANYPEEQRKFPILGLGSVGGVYGDRNVPYLNRSDAGRDLRLRWWDVDWDSNYRFLAVRKVSRPSAS